MREFSVNGVVAYFVRVHYRLARTNNTASENAVIIPKIVKCRFFRRSCTASFFNLFAFAVERRLVNLYAAAENPSVRRNKVAALQKNRVTLNDVGCGYFTQLSVTKDFAFGV